MNNTLTFLIIYEQYLNFYYTFLTKNITRNNKNY